MEKLKSLTTTERERSAGKIKSLTTSKPTVYALMCALCVGVCVAHSGRKVCYNGVVNKQKGKTMDNNNSQKNSIGKWLDKYELVLGAFMWGVAIGIALYRIPQLFALGIW